MLVECACPCYEPPTTRPPPGTSTPTAPLRIPGLLLLTARRAVRLELRPSYDQCARFRHRHSSRGQHFHRREGCLRPRGHCAGCWRRCCPRGRRQPHEMEILLARLSGLYDRPGMYAAPPQRDSRRLQSRSYIQTHNSRTTHAPPHTLKMALATGPASGYTQG